MRKHFDCKKCGKPNPKGKSYCSRECRRSIVNQRQLLDKERRLSAALCSGRTNPCFRCVKRDAVPGRRTCQHCLDYARNGKADPRKYQLDRFKIHDTVAQHPELTYRELAKIIGCSHISLSRIINNEFPELKAVRPGKTGNNRGGRLSKLRHSDERVVEFCLANPKLTTAETAKALGYTSRGSWRKRTKRLGLTHKNHVWEMKNQTNTASVSVFSTHSFHQPLYPIPSVSWPYRHHLYQRSVVTPVSVNPPPFLDRKTRFGAAVMSVLDILRKPSPSIHHFTPVEPLDDYKGREGYQRIIHKAPFFKPLYLPLRFNPPCQHTEKVSNGNCTFCKRCGQKLSDWVLEK
jgi:hypothetical protein